MILLEHHMIKNQSPLELDSRTCWWQDSVYDILTASSLVCSLSHKYWSLWWIFIISNNDSLEKESLGFDEEFREGMIAFDYVKTRCYDEDDAPFSEIYDCLAGLRYHFSDIREKPDQDNPFSLTANYYKIPSMGDDEVPLNESGIKAWQDLLDDLEAASYIDHNSIARLIGTSLPYILYDSFCSKKKYFDKYIADTEVSWVNKAEMARISLIINSYLLSKADAAAILTNYAAFTTTVEKDILLKLFLTLGTSLQGKSWMEDWAIKNNRADINDIITNINNPPQPDQSLIDDVNELLLDFIFKDDDLVTNNQEL
jgi:hypothetical protein